ncbi:MAG: nitroreductase family protein [Myxococcales bacterium]|nr:nitroreductase family protein [Myxococcales bacterium]
MDANTCIRTKRDSREYKDEAISEETLQRILQAGRMAGSSKNTQPWHFIVIRDTDTLRAIGAIATSGRFVADAPMAIAIAMENADRPELDAGRARRSSPDLRLRYPPDPGPIRRSVPPSGLPARSRSGKAGAREPADHFGRPGFDGAGPEVRGVARESSCRGCWDRFCGKRSPSRRGAGGTRASWAARHSDPPPWRRGREQTRRAGR